MDDDLGQWLFDPADAHRLVLARRPPTGTAVTSVVSDVVWHEVVRLLRWAAASTGSASELEVGRWWRLAAGCAHLLRRLPALCDELGEPWSRTAAPDQPDVTGSTRVDLVSRRLLTLLRSDAPVPLHVLAREVDALGAAAISALAEGDSWAVP